MRSHLTLVFGATDIVVALTAAEPAWASDQARRWLDEQFVALDCEPVRASGKLLTVDKVLTIAQAIGQAGFEKDAALRQAFAQAALGALARPLVRVDVDAGAVSY